MGIDNRRACHIATEHLVKLGVRRISLVAYAGGAPTVEARIAGFRECVLANGRGLENSPVHRLSAITDESIRELLGRKHEEQGFVCVNDRIAGELMHMR